MTSLAEVRVGARLPERSELIDQDRLVRYAGASGDFNRLHWDPDFAAEVSPTGGIIGHGMLSMGLVSALVTDWAGGPERVRSLSVAFRAPCPVGSALTIGAEVLEVEEAESQVVLAVWATLEDGSAVVDGRRSRAVVRLP